MGPMLNPVCIDNNFPKHLVGKITRVPTIVANRVIYMGEDAFKWLEQIQRAKFMKQQETNGEAEPSAHKEENKTQERTAEVKNDEIMGTDSFFGGMGLGYSSSDLSGNEGTSNELFEMYESLTGGGDSSSATVGDPQSMGTTQGVTSQKQQEMDKAYEQLLASRN